MYVNDTSIKNMSSTHFCYAVIQLYIITRSKREKAIYFRSEIIVVDTKSILTPLASLRNGKCLGDKEHWTWQFRAFYCWDISNKIWNMARCEKVGS